MPNSKMNPSQIKRQKLFDLYVSNLNLLVDLGHLNSEKDKYICPMCLGQFIEVESDNPLTLEDAPPKRLGGKANTLTCKSCNNGSGTKVDMHLVERIKEINRSMFAPGSQENCQIEIDGELFQATVKVDEKGEMSIEHEGEKNHPEKLVSAMKKLSAGKIVDLKWYPTKVKKERIHYALLKTALILMFQKLGYLVILDKCYNIIREQIDSPEESIYPADYWFQLPPKLIHSGVYFVNDIGLESIFVAFDVTFSSATRTFGVILPLPFRDIEQVIAEINKRFKEQEEFPMELFPFEEMDYWLNENNIKGLLQWMNERKS